MELAKWGQAVGMKKKSQNPKKILTKRSVNDRWQSCSASQTRARRGQRRAGLAKGQNDSVFIYLPKFHPCSNTSQESGET